MAASRDVRIGVDLGGTKIEAVVLASNGDIVGQARRATPREDYDATIEAITDLVSEVEMQAGARAPTVGIGIPGAISPATGLIKNANSTWLIGQPLREDLEAGTAKRVRLANDANCFALSEAVDGAGQGAASVFGVILGTGVGGGIVIDGRIHGGRNLIAGEWGHNPLPWPDVLEWPGPDCYCGRSGCIETFLSGPGLAADHARVNGGDLTGEAVVAAAQAGDEATQATLQRYERRFAKALTAMINLLDPEVIVLGGGLSNIEQLYRNVPAALEEFAFSDRLSVNLRRARHGDASGVRGAAWLWP